MILKWLSGNMEGLWVLAWSLTERVTCWLWVWMLFGVWSHEIVQKEPGAGEQEEP